MPAAPKVTSSALSSNSPTTFGRTAWRSNQASNRGRTAAWVVGSSTGTRASEAGKSRCASASRAGGAYQASGDVPSEWL